MNEYDKIFMSKFVFLAKLTPEEQNHFLSVSSYRKITAGTLLFNEKCPCQGIAFVLSGELKAFKVSESGREISLYFAKAGEACVMNADGFFNEKDAIPPVSVIATQDSVIAVLPCDAFSYHFANSPYIQQFIVKLTLEKFYDLVGLIERLMFKSVTERLWKYILDETAEGKKPLYTTHAQIAAMLGTSREVVTRRLHELENSGLIKIERGKLTMLNPKANAADLRLPPKKSR
jgi:CRP/FNR family transcriptional regulator, anaerobic regulatory protein